jgi:uncharacterized membrane protein
LRAAAHHALICTISCPGVAVRANGWKAVVNIIANIFGALGAIVFVGYFAYKLAEPPLTIIVVVCLCLMVYSFYDDMRNDRTIARFHKNKRESQ